MICCKPGRQVFSQQGPYAIITKRSKMSAHVLSIVLNELRNRDKMQGLPSILSFFRNEFNKFNNTGALMKPKPERRGF